ncbi:MAG: lysine exporter LysO family protein [Clostridiales bacterium]|nr:lysine exporter LysO family protein [Clostridiales bacterium]
MVILTVLALGLGFFYGISTLQLPIFSFVGSHSNLILYFLMFSVGISIGLQDGILKKLKEYHIRVFIIPLGITAASILGGFLCSFITRIPLWYSTAVTSGMGWYSLAGAMIGERAGADMGSIAFLSNLMREIFSFFLIPVIASKLNYLTCIAPAGATSEDTTLPMMLKYTNEETVVLSVLNGMICSFFVPILLSFCFHFFYR